MTLADRRDLDSGARPTALFAFAVICALLGLTALGIAAAARTATDLRLLSGMPALWIVSGLVLLAAVRPTRPPPGWNGTPQA